ncbi:MULTISPECIES: PTS mannose/fructose/sorbose/N-acetylgalactosamine transporter subunit IIC [Aerococcus]|uniref:PTS sugar transporter subunit IIC n=2 Tax=Aerococcus TaxID=1375 RepID=A0A5N1BS16_9LACT|nr:PTS sugar transporter subunit IIC [Aerococcus urinae]KAA9240343.1 PTS sugar transporter subunit IIC [Aerococcus urinae]MDK7801422.1 PTS sugar transporter subunit IIC [Aerococcus urinae]MDK8655038.1 PTS sugar transporter subunit IIC [Aerococcus urinae]RAV70831.1 PTS sugar transporter subunit IIC [Aerococcus urinae]RAW04681.1 PTS sugar transporter subunit IIC [Aerococcus urinae]
MDGQLIVMAIAMGLIYWLSRSMIGGYFALFFVGNAIVVGAIAGFIHGDILQGLILGGGISAVFAGIIAPGGNLPTDQTMAATTMIPIALASNLSVEQAVAFAVPLGLVGAQLINLRKIINVNFVHMADKAAENCDTKAISRDAVLYPALTAFPLLFLPVFLVVLLGQNVMLSVLEFIPSWILHGLEVAGGVMPAVGFALIINSIGKPRLIPYTLIGFILVKVLGLNNIVTGILIISIALIVVFNKKNIDETVGA